MISLQSGIFYSSGNDSQVTAWVNLSNITSGKKASPRNPYTVRHPFLNFKIKTKQCNTKPTHIGDTTGK